MTRRILILAASALALSAGAARADEKLAFLIPHLFGPTGLVVDSEARLPNGQTLIGCYHPSRQNTHTGKLTPRMMDDVFRKVREVLEVVKA